MTGFGFRAWFGFLAVLAGLCCPQVRSAMPGPSTWHLEWEPEKIVASVRKNAKHVRMSVEDNAIVLEVPPESEAAGFEFFPEFKAELRRGERVVLRMDIRGENIVPLEFAHKEPVVVVAAFPDQNGNLRAAVTPEGTFDWQTVEIQGYVPFRGKFRIVFGIRRGSGKLWVRDPRLLYQRRYPYGRGNVGGQISI